MSQEVERTYLKSSRLGPPSPLQMAVLALFAIILVPPYWLLAWLRGLPGLQVRWRCVRLGLRLLLRRRGPIDLKSILILILYPLDSTRYYELDFAWKRLARAPMGKYLDVSSPRCFFVPLLLQQQPETVDLINPDKGDLAETRKVLLASGLLPRCQLHNCFIADAPFAPAAFDLITCISVLEHIPEDRQALQKIWELLKPGGRLLLTVPCAAKRSEQYIDRDEWGLYGDSEGGPVFWQRFYDPELLQERIFSITGAPHCQEASGERSPGLFARMADRKRKQRYYPFWREPYMTVLEYQYFSSVQALPGEGVIAMEFIKR